MAVHQCLCTRINKFAYHVTWVIWWAQQMSVKTVCVWSMSLFVADICSSASVLEVEQQSAAVRDRTQTMRWWLCSPRVMEELTGICFSSWKCQTSTHSPCMFLWNCLIFFCHTWFHFWLFYITVSHGHFTVASIQCLVTTLLLMHYTILSDYIAVNALYHT